MTVPAHPHLHAHPAPDKPPAGGRGSMLGASAARRLALAAAGVAALWLAVAWALAS